MTSKPNIIMLVTDDQGYGDLGYFAGDDVCTPHLDTLCRGGAVFTDWYANGPVCSPTRASLMTGRYPQRTGVTEILAGHREAPGLRSDVPTVASRLREQGYRTLLSGKWHLGAAEEYQPHNRGFDRWFGHTAGCIDYFSHIFYWGMNVPGPELNPVHDLWEDGREVWCNGEYATELITRWAIDGIRDAHDAGTPFFLYLSYNAPHYPMHAPQKYLDRFAHLPEDRRIMAAMLSALDDGVGDVTEELQRLGIESDTLTIFTSDNGPSRESRNWLDGSQDAFYGSSSGEFRGHKRSLFEGGIRVPGAMHWPGRIPPEQVIRTPCATMDAATTALAVAGADPDSSHDGIDLLPLVADGVESDPRDLFWAYDAAGMPQTAVRRGSWKLVLNGYLEDEEPPDAVFLVNLDDDRSERVNRADAHQEIVAALSAAAHAWRVSVGGGELSVDA